MAGRSLDADKRHERPGSPSNLAHRERHSTCACLTACQLAVTESLTGFSSSQDMVLAPDCVLSCLLQGSAGSARLAAS